MTPLIYWYLGMVVQAVLLYLAHRVVKEKGCYAARDERTAQRFESNVIILQACCGWLKDLEEERRLRAAQPPRRSPPGGQRMPVLPPDSLPDDTQRRTA